ncbi:MAG: hypothetical protein MRZ74_03260 [Blautia sp.]|nr:hypothetical protein [Blautia sp.]MDY5031273.1 hypothetical protein [Blautia sp.]
MKKTFLLSGRRSGLLLTEIMIAILFFSVMSALCLQVFARTAELNRQTDALERGIYEAASAADLLSCAARDDTGIRWPDTNEEVPGQTDWKNRGETMASLAEILKPYSDRCTVLENEIRIPLDSFRLTITVTAENSRMLCCTLDFSDDPYASRKEEGSSGPIYQTRTLLFRLCPSEEGGDDL